MSADLVFVYVNHLDDDTLFLTDYYKIYNNRTAIIIKRDAIFLTEEIAHAIGHVLGAGHGHDKSKRQPLNQILFVHVAQILIKFKHMYLFLIRKLKLLAKKMGLQ